MSAQLGRENAVRKQGKVNGKMGNEHMQEIKTDLDFGTWYHSLEDDLLSASQEEYQYVICPLLDLEYEGNSLGMLIPQFREYYDQLDLSQSHLDSLLTNATSTLDFLSTLSASFKAVEVQTTAFRNQCEGLLSEQEHLTKLADKIGENVQYYNYLEPLNRRLNAPGAGNSVGSQGFSHMLSRLDQCLDYMQVHVRLSHTKQKTIADRVRPRNEKHKPTVLATAFC